MVGRVEIYSAGVNSGDSRRVTRRRLSPLFLALVIIGAVLAPIASTVHWTRSVVLDTPDFVDVVGPLTSKKELADSLTNAVITRLAETKQVAVVREQLAKRSGVENAAAIEVQAAQMIQQGVRAVVGGRAFGQAWRIAVRTAHQQLLAMMGRGNNDTGTVALDLTPLMTEVDAELLKRGVDIYEMGMPADAGVFQITNARENPKLVDLADTIDLAGFILPAVAAVLLIGGVLASVNRRRDLMIGGWVVLGASLLLVLLLLWAPSLIAGRVGSNARDGAEVVASTVLRGAVQRNLITALVGAVVAVGAWRLDAVRSLVRRPTRTKS